jgi:hypothetical protein
LKTIALTDTESERVAKILTAAQTGSWDLFKSLSEEEFSNMENMRSQFITTSKIVFDMNYNWTLEIDALPDPSGWRMIRVQVLSNKKGNQPVILLLRSENATEDSRIEIVAFYEDYEFS